LGLRNFQLIKSPSAKILSSALILLFVVLFLRLWGSLLLSSLSIDGPATVGTVFLLIKAGFFLPPFITLIYLTAPLIAIVYYCLGGKYQTISRYLALNCLGTLVAASLAIKLFSSWKGIPISIAPWKAIDLFYALDHRSTLYQHWLLCLVVTLIPALGLNAIGKIGFSKRIKEALGDAHFATSTEISKAGGFNKEGLVVGRSYGRTIRIPGMESALLAASTGSGKTSSIAVPNLLEHSGSTIVNDIKGELYALTANYRKQHFNSQCYCFNPMREEGAGDFYNPFFYVSNSPDKRIDDLFIMSEALIPETKLGEGFWYQSSRELFLLLSLFLLEIRGKATLSDVYDLSKEASLPMYLLTEIQNSGSAPSALLMQNYTALSEADEKTQRNIVKDFQSRLVFMMSPSIRRATSKNSFDLSKLRQEKMSVYLSIPTGFQGLLSPLLTVFWTQVTHLMTKHEPNIKNEPYSVLCLLDEFGMMERINRIKDGLSFLRSYRVRFIIIVQYLSQIVSKYGRDDAKSFFNTKTKIIFTPSDFDDAKILSAALGTKAVKMQSKSINSGSMERSGHMTTNYQHQSKPLMRPDELMKMNKKIAIVMVEGQSPIKVNKLYWFKDGKFKNMVESKPGSW
jgi:type IV secretion system protein VirD4